MSEADKPPAGEPGAIKKPPPGKCKPPAPRLDDLKSALRIRDAESQRHRDRIEELEAINGALVREIIRLRWSILAAERPF